MRDDIAMTTGNSQDSGSPDITDLGNDVYQIDTRMAGYQGITAGYLIRSSRPCLVETGTSTSAPVVQAALASLGIGPADLATVVVTHIHLDHAGGVGDIASMFGGAQVVVHEKGARHLADPSRLMASARMVYGDALDVLFGSMMPVDRPTGCARWTTWARSTSGTGGGCRATIRPGTRGTTSGWSTRERRPVRGGRGRGLHPGDRGPAPGDPAAGLRPAGGACLARPVRLARPVPAAVQPLRAGDVGGVDARAVGRGDLGLGLGDARGAGGGDGPRPRGRGGPPADDVAVPVARGRRPIRRWRRSSSSCRGRRRTSSGIWHWLDKLEQPVG